MNRAEPCSAAPPVASRGLQLEVGVRGINDAQRARNFAPFVAERLVASASSGGSLAIYALPPRIGCAGVLCNPRLSAPRVRRRSRDGGSTSGCLMPDAASSATNGAVPPIAAAFAYQRLQLRGSYRDPQCNPDILGLHKNQGPALGRDPVRRRAAASSPRQYLCGRR